MHSEVAKIIIFYRLRKLWQVVIGLVLGCNNPQIFHHKEFNVNIWLNFETIKSQSKQEFYTHIRALIKVERISETIERKTKNKPSWLVYLKDAKRRRISYQIRRCRRGH